MPITIIWAVEELKLIYRSWQSWHWHVTSGTVIFLSHDAVNHTNCKLYIAAEIVRLMLNFSPEDDII
jgi:hypothetical protein